ncbi:MAG: hypothetical protein K2X71_00825 [Methylobacterium sp.]|uniref:hypothetical protein n=1 Tax=Methylobacterium sp. TaxID=409 RepID=UPI00258E1A0B|nr:hypothetical protein [Methylobacterium sp.]MBY0294573.1 hypothetical protein [Methylobacterium sp.]
MNQPADTPKTRSDQPGFRQDGTAGDKHLPDNRQDKLNERLDEGLEETFPTSDPVSVKVTK